MRFFSGLIIGFILGTFYALYQTLEKPEGVAVKLMEGIKTILGVL